MRRARGHVCKDRKHYCRWNIIALGRGADNEGLQGTACYVDFEATEKSLGFALRNYRKLKSKYRYYFSSIT